MDAMITTARVVRLVLVLAMPAAHAAQVEVTDAWVRATVPGQPVAGAYMTLRSQRDAKVVAVQSPVAKGAEIHSMSNEGDVMKMRKLDALALPAGQRVELTPHGNHIMLLDIVRQLKAGDSVPITLTVERGKKKTKVRVDAPVREAP
jgi:copper(I)-binding protein